VVVTAESGPHNEDELLIRRSRRKVFDFVLSETARASCSVAAIDGTIRTPEVEMEGISGTADLTFGR
jgi:hypothetical protein